MPSPLSLWRACIKGKKPLIIHADKPPYCPAQYPFIRGLISGNIELTTSLWLLTKDGCRISSFATVTVCTESGPVKLINHDLLSCTTVPSTSLSVLACTQALAKIKSSQTPAPPCA